MTGPKCQCDDPKCTLHDAPKRARVPKGRANTTELKRRIVERVLEAWGQAPELRLGQLLVNAASVGTNAMPGVYYIEDLDLVNALDAFVTRLK